MSINTSYVYLEQLLAQQQAQAGAAGDTGGLVFPYFNPTNGSTDSDIDTQWTTGTSFDTSIPYNSDGTININAMLQKLHDILYYSYQGDNMDYNSIMDATAYLMNIGSVWGQIEAQGAASQVTSYLTLPITNPSNPNDSQSIIDLVAQIGIPSVIDGTYWSSNGNTATTLAFAKNLVNELNAISGQCSLLAPLDKEANTLYGNNGSTLTSWMSQNPASSMTFNEYAFMQALSWQTAFSDNAGAANYFNSWRSTELSTLLAGASGNPFLEYILVMYVLMNENGDMQTTIAGQGNLTNYLSTPMGNNAQEIASEFSAGGFTAASAQNFYSQIMELSTLAQNQSVSSLAPQISQIFEALTDPNSDSASQISSTFSFMVGKTTYTGTMTLAQIFHSIQAAQGGGQPAPITITPNGSTTPVTFQPTWTDMANALNGLQPTSAPVGGNNPTPSYTTQPGYTTLSNLVQQVTNSITSKSSAIGQIMQNDEGVNEKDLSMIQAAAEEIISPEKEINQNMAQANS